MAPHLLSTGADVPWGGLQLMLIAVFAVGMLAALLAVREAVRTPILSTLRARVSATWIPMTMSWSAVRMTPRLP